MEMDTLFLILGPYHLFFLFVILVLQNTSRPTPSAYPNPTRKYHISFLLSSRHEATATVQTPKSKLLFHIKSYINSFFVFFFFFLIDYIDRIFFFLGDILIEFNTCNHALIKTWFTKKKKNALIKTLLSNIIIKLKIHIIKTLLSNLIRIFKHLLKLYYLIRLEN